MEPMGKCIFLHRKIQGTIAVSEELPGLWKDCKKLASWAVGFRA